MTRLVACAALLAVAACQPLDLSPIARDTGTDPVVILVGDSTAWTAGWLVEPVDGVELHIGAGIGCGLDPAAILVDGRAEQIIGLPVPCEQHEDLWIERTDAADPDVVLLILGAWEVFDRVLADGTVLEVGTPGWAAWLDESLERAGDRLAGAAPHAVVAVTDVPCFDERGPVLGGAASPRNDPAAIALVNERLAAFVGRHPARLVWLPWSSLLCGPGAFERPDGVHLSVESARALWAGPLGEAVRSLG